MGSPNWKPPVSVSGASVTVAVVEAVALPPVTVSLICTVTG